MVKKSILILAAGTLLLSASGCILLMAGTGAISAAVWLEGKISQDFNVPFDRTIAAAKKGLASLKLDIAKETRKETICQLISSYYDGRMIWVDIRRISDTLSQVEVRVGAMGDQPEARKIMARIRHYAH